MGECGNERLSRWLPCAIVAGIAVLCVLGVEADRRPEWDSALHLLTARSLAEGAGFALQLRGPASVLEGSAAAYAALLLIYPLHHPRFLLPLLPLVYAYLLAGLAALAALVLGRFGRVRLGSAVVPLVAVLCLGLLNVDRLPLALAADAGRTPSGQTLGEVWRQRRAAADWLREHTPEDAVVVASAAPVMSVLAERREVPVGAGERRPRIYRMASGVDPPPSPDRRADRAAASETVRPNVVLISIDSLRADHLGSYGYPRPTSPSIDRLASEGVLFEVAVSSTSWTLPAHASLFTGLPDSIHGCTLNTSSLAPERRTLAEALREAGYRTAGFWSAPYLDPRFGMGQGFDDYISCTGYGVVEDVPPGKAGEQAQKWIRRANTLSHADVTSPRIVEKVTRWLDSHAERPFFLFIHMWDVHYDYLAPPPYDAMFDPAYTGTLDGRVDSRDREQRPPERDLQHLVALYDGEVAWTDHHVGMLLDLLDERDLAENTLVVLTADHGEEFYEHGRFGHRATLFEESIRIPLIVRQRGRLPAGSRISELVQIVDIAPTILDLAGVKRLPDITGRSLAPLLRGDGASPREIALSELVKPRAERTLIGIRTPAWKLVARSEGREPIGLWDLRRDPAEERNLYGVEDALTVEARRTLSDTLEQLERLRERHRLETPPEPRELPEDLERQLEALGYLEEQPDD